MNSVSSKTTVPEALIRHISGIIDEYSAVPIRSEKLQKLALTENLLILSYLHAPEMQYADCLRSIQNLHSAPIELPNIRRIAENGRIDNPNIRIRLTEWARRTAELLHSGMAGNREAFEEALRLAKTPVSDYADTPHPMQSRFLLFAMYEFIPELHASPSYANLRKLGRKYCQVCLNKSLDSIAFDLQTDDTVGDAVPAEDLRREVYLAKRELEEYRAMVEAADADLEAKIEERCRGEIAEFFRSLNDPRYGHIIDSVYLQHRACGELRRSGETIPYLLEGIPGMLEKMLRFFRDSGISPAIRFPPNSLHKLTVQQMEGCQFEPHPARTSPLTEESTVTVRIISSGWRCGGTIISCPILREETTSR
ncbi:MAG: hypothetical protein IKU40_03755 [Clostridia bacterium]|nr:hypothetical protein [Clostridia bacterium]